jgi:hypothetical protein
MAAMRRSNRAGGIPWGVDMVMTAEIFGDGRRDVATIPPIEWPMTMMDVPVG